MKKNKAKNPTHAKLTLFNQPLYNIQPQFSIFDLHSSPIMNIPPQSLLSFILMLGVLSHTSSYGRQNTITGCIINHSTKEPVKFAHIQNYSNHAIAITDTNGLFIIRASPGDTLIFSAIGYFYKKVTIADLLMKRGIVPVFELMVRIYDIDEANIYIPGTYQKFKRDFIELEIPKTREDILRENLGMIASIEGKKAYDQAIATGRIEPPAPGFPILSADEKARLRLKIYISRQKNQNIIYEKYNVEIVKQVTGLTDDDEAMSFMLFCNFDEQYLLQVNQLDLMKEIADQYELYKKEKTS